MKDILLVLIIPPDTDAWLQRNAIEKATETLSANDYYINLHIERRPAYMSEAASLHPWSSTVKMRNKVLQEVQFWDYHYLLWIDPNAIMYPSDLPSRLIDVVPDGVVAPIYAKEGQVTTPPDTFIEARANLGQVHLVNTDIYLNGFDTYTDAEGGPDYNIIRMARSEGKRAGFTPRVVVSYR